MTKYINQESENQLSIENIEQNLLYLQNSFPKEAVSAAINQKVSITPKLLACLNHAIENRADLEDDYIGHLFAVFLLSQFQEESAFPLIIKLARLPENEVDTLIGDCITEDLHRFIAATYDGDLISIKNLIEDIEVNEWSRKAGLRALVVLVKAGRIESNAVEEYLSSLFDHPSFIDDDEQITHLVTVCCDFAPKRFYDEIQKAFEEQKVDEFVINMADFKLCLSRPSPKYIDDHYTLIEDTIAEMEFWPCFKNSNKRKSSGSLFSPEWFEEDSHASMVSTQVVRGAPKIGRNEPCPCNSGKKYKKCCLLLH
ncbi:DUF1186 domain-containing protein [Legionella nagasakiensis]|uniref:DUF1186 domain-containing protein n=1 Tax=Legionella nagasakiensis TaxID=535290 RepID=UPI001056B591|nr:DUF1186 domain-containing protein [Legionella nagasakiensis]